MDTPTKGPIAWMARNPVAANLAMAVLFLAGLLGLTSVKQEVFPSFSLDMVLVQVPYPGAGPEEVEQGILLAIEEEIRGIEGVKRVSGTAAEGFGQARAELLIGADADRVLADIKTAVDRITSFPEEAEEPSITLLSRRQTVVSLVVSGDQDARTLHEVAERIRERLVAHPDVTQVELQGVRPLEIAVEISQEQLESYGLTPELVAAQIRGASLELPAGSLKTESGELLVRLSDRRRTGEELADVVLRGTRDGSEVRLGDLARVTDGYADEDLYSYYDGKPAVRVVAYRVGDESPQQVSAAVRQVADEMRGELPENVQLSVWDDDSELLVSRIDLLLRNARMGLVLVLLVLAAFLDLRLSFWVAAGIPISVLGAFALMPTLDVSVNMISLFAFIVTLGIVVDDAIVVGENIYEKEQQGIPRLQAAIDGAREMVVPVSFSILTTMVAFAPMLVVPGVMGKIFRILPVLVITVLGVSWVESFFVLPSHLGHHADWLARLTPAPLRWAFDRVEALRRPIGQGLTWFGRRVYGPTVERLVAWRYATVAAGFALFVLTVGVVGSGWVPFTFFPALEGDVVTAAARLPYGVPIERTLAVQRALEEAARRTIADSGGDAIVRGMYTTVGQGATAGGPGGGAAAETGSHLVTVEIQLVPTDERDVSSEVFASRWSAATPPMAGIDSLTFNATFGPGAGAAVDVQLAHPDIAVLEAASAEILDVLRSYPTLTNHENTFASGKPQLDFHLLPAAAGLGLTGGDVARQLRSAFFGAEALREQRGRNELKVMVRLPKEQRDSEYHLERLQVRAPSGALVPLSHVASFERGRAPTAITREEGNRVVDVKAELVPGAKSAQDVLKSLQDEVFPALQARYPRLKIELAGQQREQGEAFASLGRNTLLALVVMYALIAVPFRSYIQPIIVMAAIPLGFTGAVIGHLVMGYGLSIISLFGIVALSGVAVNDSLVLIDTTNQLRAEGADPPTAVTQAGVRRLRPILLTSLTTFFGLAPMILETSVQARFLIPMAISLGFGVLFTTLVTLLLVPALYTVIEDLRSFGVWLVADPEAEATQPAALDSAAK